MRRVVPASAAADNDNEGVIDLAIGPRQGTYRITVDELADPVAWIMGTNGREAVKAIAESHWYRGYQRWDEPMDLKTGTEMAERMIDLIKSGESGRCAIDPNMEYYCHASDQIDHVTDDRDEVISAIGGLCRAKGIRFDRGEWREVLNDGLVERLNDDDASTSIDLLGRHDLAEIAFDFCGRIQYVEDAMITAAGSTAAMNGLCVDGALQANLSGLGYSIRDYRRMTGCTMKPDGLRRGVRKRQVPLIDPDQLRNLADNACTAYFNIALYAMVPLRDVADLRLDRPIRFSSAAVCSYNSVSGNFHHETTVRDVVVKPHEGRLRAINGYTPNRVCGGLSRHEYHSRIGN